MPFKNDNVDRKVPIQHAKGPAPPSADSGFHAHLQPLPGFGDASSVLATHTANTLATILAGDTSDL